MRPDPRNSIIFGLMLKWNSKLIVLAIMAGLFLSLTQAGESGTYHEGDNALACLLIQDSLPTGKNALFAGSGKCLPCHGTDPLGIANVDLLGTDINVVDAWRASMMANSAKDPFWRAKVSHEVSVYPQHQEVIEDKCTTCHAPLAHFSAHYEGAEFYSFEEIHDDSLALDGVSCLACHQQSPQGIGVQHSGNITFESDSIAYGQYESPLESPMVQVAHYTPVFSEHIEDAGICGGCHTLITETIDLDGNFTGDSFVEQATYHEWLNSDYNESITCQGCHMPAVTKGEVIIITGYDTEPRSPFFKHEFAGANSFMLQLMKENLDTLGISASLADFDFSIENTLAQLQQESLSIDLELLERDDQIAIVELGLQNFAGHKLPSGYPSRRVFVQFEATDEDGNVLLESGMWDDDYRLDNEDLPFEIHHDVISSSEQVQIYEMVMGDINGDFTTILDQGYEPLKDNRLLPLGFSLTHPVYDTTIVAGAALSDPNYGVNDVSNKDKITFEVALDGYTGLLHFEARAYYQSLPQRWMDQIFEVETEAIDFFESMYYNADRSPVLMDSDELDDDIFVGITGSKEELFSVNPKLGSGEITIKVPSPGGFQLVTSSGQVIRKEELMAGSQEFKFDIPAGIYYVVLRFGGEVAVERIMVI